jgi:hypothetical protein
MNKERMYVKKLPPTVRKPRPQPCFFFLFFFSLPLLGASAP